MRILYIGSGGGTSGHRTSALLRLGHEVTVIDPYNLIPSNRLVNQWRRQTGGLGLVDVVHHRLLKLLGLREFDLAWVDHGELVSARLVHDLRKRIPRILCYNIDDPFGSRDRRLWREFKEALPAYDLLVVVRPVNQQEAYELGAKRVLRVFMSADEIAHAPRQLTASQHERWKSEVVFVGTAFPERGPFLSRLVALGVPLTLYGNRYQRLPEWPILKHCWRADDADSVDNYASAILAAKVSLGLLSKGNRDQHTTRTMEIPSLGGLLCAERTPEHLALYQQDHEAVFWATPEECAATCFSLLADQQRRTAIAASGHRRYLKNPWQNMKVVQSILDEAASAEAFDPLASAAAQGSPQEASAEEASQASGCSGLGA